MNCKDRLVKIEGLINKYVNALNQCQGALQSLQEVKAIVEEEVKDCKENGQSSGCGCHVENATSE